MTTERNLWTLKATRSLLGGALCIAIFNIVKKEEFNRHGKFWNTRAALFTGLVNGSVSILLFFIAACTGGVEGKGGWLLALLGTAALNIIIQFANTKAILLEDASLVVPVGATTPATIVFASMVILGEIPTSLGWAGISVIATGTYVLNIQAYLEKKKEVRTWRDWLAPFLMLGKSRGIQWAFASALIATVSLNLDALAYRQANVAFVGGCVFAIVGAVNLFAAWRNGEWTVEKTTADFSKLNLLAIIVLHTGAIWFSSDALRHGITPYVGTLKRLQIPMVIILAYIFLGEKENFRSRFVGGILMAFGAALIALA
ncbi:MAG: hypothetical protein HYV67_03255 [Candidatus Taylorbacteria bacterium]|nr:hypothetical protein [Candidatus Taylorbacteria bacterium]